MKYLKKITENLSENSDFQEIKDILTELDDEYGLETTLIQVEKDKLFLIMIKGYFQESNLFDTLEKFSKDINNVVKRLDYFSNRIDIAHYSIDCVEYDGDGETIELKDKFKVWINIYLNI